MANNENLIPIPGRLHSVATEGHVSGANEIYDDSLQKDQATINQEVQEAIGSGGSVDTKIANAINALDATKSQAAGADGLALSVSEVDGKITSISGSIAANTYDANGAAAAVKSEVLGSGVGTDYNTLKKIEDKLSPIETAVGTGGSIDQRIEDATEDCAYLGENDGSSVIANFDPQTDTVWKKAQTLSNAEKAQVKTNLGLPNEVYSKTEVNELVSTPHQNYVTVSTYAELPASGSTDTIYRVSNYDGTQVAAGVYSEYAWSGSAYVFLAAKSSVGEVFDISEYHAGTKYANLAAALDSNNGGGVPQSLQKGGMSVKYVSNSDNKYVQSRCMAQNFTTDITQWQGVDDAPIFGSNNLVKSGGVKESFDAVYEKIQKRNVDRNNFTEYTTNYNPNASGIPYNPNGGLYCTAPIKAGTIVEITYGATGPTGPSSACCCLLNLPNPTFGYGSDWSVQNKRYLAQGDNVFAGVVLNTTITLTAVVDCWLFIEPNSDYSWWPVSIITKSTDNIYDDLNNKIEADRERITTLEEKEAALPAKTTIESVLPFYPNPQCYPVINDGCILSDSGDYVYKTRDCNNYTFFMVKFAYQTVSAKKYVVAAKIRLECEKEGTYQFDVFHNESQFSVSFSGCELNKTLILYGESTDNGAAYNTWYARTNNFKFEGAPSYNTKYPVTFKIYGIYLIDPDEFNFVAGCQNVLDYTKNKTTLYNSTIESAHSATSDYSAESNHSEDSDMAIEATKLRTTLYNKKYVVLGDSLVTYSSGFFGKAFSYLGLSGRIPGIGGGRVNNWGTDRKNGFCTIENLALLPKDMKVLVFWGGANDYNLYAYPPVGEDGINNEKFGNMSDKPLGVADMFNYRVTLENMDILDTPGRTQTFIQAYKTLLRNISILFPHTLLVCVTQYRAYTYQWSQGKDSVTFRKAYPRVIGAEKDCAAEYGVPVCDLFTKAGVNDSNCFSLLYDDGGSLIHPNGVLAERCTNLMAHTVQENTFLTEPEYNWSYNLSSNDKDVRELKEYLVDLRSEDEYNVMTLEEAIQGFISYTTEKSITLKNNMYLVFYNNQYGNSLGYFLIDYENPSNVNSWEQWTNDIIYDMRTAENPQTHQPFGVLTLNQAIVAFQAKATLERWEYSNIMYMYFYTDANNNWSMYRLTNPSAPSSTSSWTLVKSGQTNT